MFVRGRIPSTKLTSMVLLISVVCFRFGTSCGGHNVTFRFAKNCPGMKSVPKVSNVSAVFDKDCYLFPMGCVTTASGFKAASVEYSISRNRLLPLKGVRDLCQGLQDATSETVAILQIMGVPNSCPFTPSTRARGSICKKINASRLRGHLPMVVGTIQANATITHDVGKSCISSMFDIYKI